MEKAQGWEEANQADTSCFYLHLSVAESPPSTGDASAKRGKHDDLYKRLSEVEDAVRTFKLPLCVICSTQTSYTGEDLDITSSDTEYKCPICADPRQYIGPSGQTWTTLPSLIENKEQKYHNVFETLISGQVWAFETTPKFGIGQRAFLIKDEDNMKAGRGLVMWDCVAYFDDETLARIEDLSQGQGISDIVVSHPHYYSTTALWAAAFPNAKLWLAETDFHVWYQRRDVVDQVKPASEASLRSAVSATKQIRFVKEVETALEDAVGSGSPPNFKILLLGGHFPGSLVLLWRNVLFTADTIQVVPSGLYKSDQPRRDDVASVSFLWR